MAENYVCNGAKIECQLCTKPEGTLMVTSNQIKVQDKLFATSKDKGKSNLIFQGNCKKSPYQASPCAGVIAPVEWQGVADLKVQEAPALLASSTIMCGYGGIPIKITDDLQKCVLTELTPDDTDGLAPNVQPKMLIESAIIIPEKKTQTILKRRLRNADEEQEDCYAIETIKILDLDEGSDNKGSGGTQKGMVYGKEYKLKVKKYFDNKKPENLDSIKWAFTYIPDDGSVLIGAFKETGEEVTFKADNLDLCGKTISFYAYVEDREGEASLDVFHHYRFRWFDRKKVLRQAGNRKIRPWLVDQGQTSLCGMACIFYLLAKKDPNGYYKLVEELHKVGKAAYNKYTIEPNSDSPEMYDVEPSSSDHPNIPEVDWITMAVTRSKESDFGYTGKTGQDASAINWPWILTKLGKKLLGYKTAEMDYYKINKSYIRDLFGSDEKIRILEKDIDVDYKNGYEICMMIDGDMVNKFNITEYDISDLGEYHWITYEGGLKLLNKNQKTETDYDEVTNIEFNVHTWGELRDGKTLYYYEKILEYGDPMPKIELLKNQFRANYYGYLKLK